MKWQKQLERIEEGIIYEYLAILKPQWITFHFPVAVLFKPIPRTSIADLTSTVLAGHCVSINTHPPHPTPQTPPTPPVSPRCPGE